MHLNLATLLRKVSWPRSGHLFFSFLHPFLIVLFSSSSATATEIEPAQFCLTAQSSFNSNEATYHVKPGKRRRLGTVKGVEIWLAVRAISSDSEEVIRSPLTCFNLEYSWKGKLRVVELHSQGWVPVEERIFESAQLNGKGQIILRVKNEGRYERVGAEESTTYHLDLERGSLSEARYSATSPSEEEESKMIEMFRRGYYRKAFSLLQKSDRDPTGQGSDLTAHYFLEISDLLFPALQKRPPQEVARLAANFLQALGSPVAVNPKMVQGSSLQTYPSPGLAWWLKLRDVPDLSLALVQHVNDLAFFLAANGPTDDSIRLLEWVVEAAPGRTVAHRNLADLYWARGKKSDALRHYYVYQEQTASFFPGRQSALKEEIRALLTPTPVFTPEEKRRWLGFSVAQISGRRTVDFQGPPLLPMKWSVSRRDEKSGFSYVTTNLSFFWIEGAIAIQGVPVDPARAAAFEDKGYPLIWAQLAASFSLNGVRCAAAHEFSRAVNGLFACTLDGNQEVRGIPLLGGTEIRIDANGSPFEFTPARPYPLDGYVLQPGRPVTLRPDLHPGSLVQFTIAEPLNLTELKIPAGSQLGLHCEKQVGLVPPENLKACSLSVESSQIMTVRGWKFFYDLSLSPGFHVQGGYIADDWQGPQGRFCAKGNYLASYEDSDPKRIICHDPNQQKEKIPSPLNPTR